MPQAQRWARFPAKCSWGLRGQKTAEAMVRPTVRTKENSVHWFVCFHKMGNCLGEGLSRVIPGSFEGPVCTVPLPWGWTPIDALQQSPLQTTSAALGWNSAKLPWARSSWLIEQLQVQADHNLACGDFVQQETLCNWTLGTLVLLDVSHTDLRATQKI